MSGSPGTNSSYKVLKTQRGLVPLLLKILENDIAILSSEPISSMLFSRQGVLYGGGFQLRSKIRDLTDFAN